MICFEGFVNYVFQNNPAFLFISYGNRKVMFGLFKKKSKREKLNQKYEKLMEESYNLSKTDRKASDEKRAEAEAILKEMDELAD